MPTLFGNRIAHETSTTGTGSTIALGAAVARYQTLADAGIADGTRVHYVIEDGNNWEIGTADYDSGAPELTDRTPIESSNSDNEINLSGGAQVHFPVPASFFNDDVEQIAFMMGMLF